MQIRLSASLQLAECNVCEHQVPGLRCIQGQRITSGVRISPITNTSGFSRNASMMPARNSANALESPAGDE